MLDGTSPQNTINNADPPNHLSWEQNAPRRAPKPWRRSGEGAPSPSRLRLGPRGGASTFLFSSRLQYRFNYSFTAYSSGCSFSHSSTNGWGRRRGQPSWRTCLVFWGRRQVILSLPVQGRWRRGCLLVGCSSRSRATAHQGTRPHHN